MQNTDQSPAQGVDGHAATAPITDPTDTDAQPFRIEPTFVAMELAQTIENYRLVITLSTQIATVMVLANVTLVGYSIAQKSAGVLLICAIFPIGIIVTVIVNSRIALPIAYSGICMEYKYGRREAEWVSRTFFSVLISHAYTEELLRISRIPDLGERMARLRKMKGPVLGTGRGIIRACLGVLALGQIIAAIFLSQYTGWRLF